MSRLTRLWLSPLPAASLGLLVVTGGVLQLILRRAWLTGAVETALGAGLIGLSLLRSANLRAGMQLGHELGLVEGRQQAREEMYGTLREARARGMTPVQWLERELERDRGEPNRG